VKRRANGVNKEKVVVKGKYVDFMKDLDIIHMGLVVKFAGSL